MFALGEKIAQVSIYSLSRTGEPYGGVEDFLWARVSIRGLRAVGPMLSRKEGGNTRLMTWLQKALPVSFAGAVDFISPPK